MDPVGTTASLIAILGLALQSAKTIHQAISDFRDREEVVQRALRNLSSLQSLLQQLSELRDGLVTDARLPILIKHCKVDLDRFEVEIAKFRTLRSDKMIQKAWKRFKSTMLGSEGLAQIGNTMQAHVTVLGLQLHILQK